MAETSALFSLFAWLLEGFVLTALLRGLRGLCFQDTRLKPILQREKHRNIPRRYSATAINNQANSHNFKTLNWIYLQRLSLPNLRWFFADGRVKQAKDWRLQLTFRRAKKISVMDIQPYVSLHSRGSVCYVIQADKCSVLDFGPFVWQLRFVDKTWQTRRNVVRKSLKVRPTATLLTKSSTLSVKWRLAKHFSKTHRR